MADSVRSACYSNVHVYEFPVRGIPVMIRKEDSYVNATQILRAAGLPKPARTKVLEREVTRGVHEKVQGGYAGSQGTWIPLESAKLLADTYGIRDECEQLFSYDMSSGLAESVSPPLKQKKTVQPKPSNSDVEQSSSDERTRDKIKSSDYVGVKREVREVRRQRKSLILDDEDDLDETSSVDSNRYNRTLPKKPLNKPKGRLTSDRFSEAQMARLGSSQAQHAHRKCEVCGVTETPQWRRGPSGKRTLCNACGVKWSSGRLVLSGPPGSPFPFTTTESEPYESSDGNSGTEEIEVGSSSWKLQLEVSRLKSKLREVDRNHRRLVKLVSEGVTADKQVDRSYRKLMRIAKKSQPKTYSPVKSQRLNDLFIKSEFKEELADPKITVQYGDASARERQLETICISNFISLVKDS